QPIASHCRDRIRKDSRPNSGYSRAPSSPSTRRHRASVSIVIVMEPHYDLALMARHDAAAARRFSGPDYLTLLSEIHRTLRPATYVEIGVMWGESLRLALPETRALGIDPHPRATDPRIYRMTSRAFFATHDPAAILGGPIEFAFIDGRHLFEEALADF